MKISRTRSSRDVPLFVQYFLSIPSLEKEEKKRSEIVATLTKLTIWKYLNSSQPKKDL